MNADTTRPQEQDNTEDLPDLDGEWELKRLGDIASFFKGSGLSKADLSPDGKRRCILYGELFTTYGERITEVLHGTNREGAFFYSLQNDVLMPTSDVTPNGLATASYIPFSGIILGSDILVIRAPEHLINGEFLAYTIKVHRNQVMRLVSGTTVFHLYGRDMANFRFYAPSVKEQRAIVEVLSDVDSLIQSLDALIAKKRAIKQATMQQLLTGKTRLPGFSGAWAEKPLVDLAALTMGQSPPSKFYNLQGLGLPLIQGNADIEGRRTIDRVWTTQTSKYCDAGDLILTVRAPVGTVAIARKEACLGRGVCGLKAGQGTVRFYSMLWSMPRGVGRLSSRVVHLLPRTRNK